MWITFRGRNTRDGVYWGQQSTRKGNQARGRAASPPQAPLFRRNPVIRTPDERHVRLVPSLPSRKVLSLNNFTFSQGYPLPLRGLRASKASCEHPHIFIGRSSGPAMRGVSQIRRSFFYLFVCQNHPACGGMNGSDEQITPPQFCRRPGKTSGQPRYQNLVRSAWPNRPSRDGRSASL